MKPFYKLTLPLVAAIAAAWPPAAAPAAQPPPSELPQSRQVRAALQRQDGAPKQLHIVLLADKKDHKINEHDYPLWQDRWALLLGGRGASGATQVNLFGSAIAHPHATAGAENVRVVRAQGWPTEEQFASADVIVAFCYLAWNDERKQQLQRYLDRGGGLVLIHAATWTKPQADPEVAALVGVGGFRRYRHGPMNLEIIATDHPICKGLPRHLPLLDESYWPPTPAPDPKLVRALAASQEQDPVTPQPSAQPMFWTFERIRGRVVGCVPGHYTWTFDNPWFRALLLRGIAWASGGPVYRFDPLVLRGARVADN